MMTSSNGKIFRVTGPSKTSEVCSLELWWWWWGWWDDNDVAIDDDDDDDGDDDDDDYDDIDDHVHDEDHGDDDHDSESFRILNYSSRNELLLVRFYLKETVRNYNLFHNTMRSKLYWHKQQWQPYLLINMVSSNFADWLLLTGFWVDN